jgi:hypothetical protein
MINHLESDWLFSPVAAVCVAIVVTRRLHTSVASSALRVVRQDGQLCLTIDDTLSPKVRSMLFMTSRVMHLYR